MSSQLIASIVAITLALVLYTVGVFSERKSGILKKPHVVTFWLGLVCDTTGTTIMGSMAKGDTLGSTASLVHGITGGLAIVLMLFHAVWATVVLSKDNVAKQENFHKFSIVVWLIWLVPYILGMAMGMSK